MGKSALLLATALLISWFMSSAEQNLTKMDRTKVVVEYEEDVLARQIAYSALNVVVRQASLDFENYREAISGQDYRDGHFDYSAVGDPGEPLIITASGEVNGARHTVSAVMDRTGSAPLDALIIDGPIGTASANGSAHFITGMDTDPGGAIGSGSNANAHAIRVTLESASAILNDGLYADQVYGLGGDGDIIVGAPPIDLDSLAVRVKNHADRIEFAGDQIWTGNDTYGSMEEPVILVVDGNLDLRGTVTGFGVLYVDGSMSIATHGTASWTGLTFLADQGGSLDLKGTADFFGSVIVRTLTDEDESGGEEDSGLLTGHFDVSIFDGAKKNPHLQVHQYDDRYDRTWVEIAQNGCEDAGALCWSDIMGDSEAETIRAEFVNHASTEGDFVFNRGSLQIVGETADGFSQEFDPGDLESFVIDVGAVCSLPAGNPIPIKNDEEGRAGAFTIRFTDADSGELLYDAVLYHHQDDDSCESEENAFVQVLPLEFAISGNTGIQYSSAALEMLGDILPEITVEETAITLTNVRETPTRRVEEVE